MTQFYDADRSRLTVAQEAARIIVDHGITDYRVAKQKAAERLGLNRFGALPSNQEIESALVEHHRLFSPDDHHRSINERRNVALGIMKSMAEFEPRLVGPLLAGTASADSPANLHLFADTPENVAWFLDSRSVAYGLFERRLQVRRGKSRSFPGYRFRWDTLMCEATVFPYDGLRQAPLSPVDGRPMKRASVKKLRALLVPDGTA